MTGQQNGVRQSGSLVDDKAGRAQAALKERPSLDLHEILDLPRGSYAWVRSEDPRFQFGSPDRGAMPRAEGTLKTWPGFFLSSTVIARVRFAAGT